MFSIEKTTQILLIVLFPILIIFFMFWFFSLDVQWYKKEFIKLNIYKEVDKNMADMSISNIVLYFQDKELLNKYLFSQQARNHLFDVKIIFQTIQGIFIIATLLNAALLVYMGYTLRWKHVIKYFNESLIITCIFLFFIGIFIVFFHTSFQAMHKFIFVNDLWLFDQSDPLIQLLPERLFFDLGIRIYIFSYLLSIFLLLPVSYIKNTIKINN